ncbi:MAG: Calx-beta domain-containing protein [Paracoccaceae bacterium]
MAILTIDSAAVTESDSNFLDFVVTLSEPSLDSVTVNFRTLLDGTALNGDLDNNVTGSSNNGTVTFAPGVTSQSIFIETNTDSLDEVDESIVIELFDPVGAELSGGAPVLRATGVILDNDGAGPNLAMFVSDPVITEGDSGQSFAVFEVTLSQPAPSAFSAAFTTVDGTALAGQDYTATSGALTFVEGQQTASVSVPILGDLVGEAAEVFSLAVTPPSSPSIAAIGATGEALILDTDTSAFPEISIAGDAVTESDSNFLRFVVTLSEPSLTAVSVTFNTSAGTAVQADLDNLITGSSNNGTLTFDPGETSKSIFIETNTDSIDERDETIFVSLSNPIGAEFANDENEISATGFILDNDGAGQDISIGVADRSIRETLSGAEPYELLVQISQSFGADLTFDVTVVDGTAIEGSDFSLLDSQVTFVAGQTSSSVRLTVDGTDTTSEIPETVVLNFAPSSGALFSGPPAQATVTILNRPNTPPTITSDPAFVAAENQTTAGIVTATDAESDVSFAITGGVDAALFSINAATGSLNFKVAPDFEAPGDTGANNTYDIQITATDAGGLTAVQSVIVTVTDVNEAPTIDSAAALTAAENQTAAGAVVVSDDKTGVQFSITGGADAALFTINGSTGGLLFNNAPNFETPVDADANNDYDVQITATDAGGLTAIQSLTIMVTDANEAPVAIDAEATGDEDTVISGALTASDDDGDTLSFSLVNGPSNGVVTINANGSFQFTPIADFNGTDSFTFRASDGALSDTATATITVNPVDEPVDPVDPVDPIDPVDPVDPIDPVDPPNPIDPPNPVDPPAPTGPTTGDDTLLGTAQNDTINALAGNDNVSGLAGDDLLIGGSGNDSIKGAAGDDRLRGNGGDDTLKGGGGDDNLKGGGGGDVIRGNGGDDVIRAGGGEDNVKGGGGADLIFGGGGADKLNGGGGADTLRGNGGDDTLKGNGGADVFQFRTSDRNDTIADFRQGQDKIQIQNGVQTFEGLDIEQDGRDVLISFGAGQVRIVTDNVAAFDESDFIF